MSDTNPFQSARVTTTSASPSDSALYTATVYLAQTRPWLLFLGVIGLLFAGLIILLGIGVGLTMVSTELGAAGAIMGLIYTGFGVLYAIPPVMMIQQAMAITTVTSGGGFDAVNEVLRYSRNFWRVLGGFTLVMMVLYCGGIGLVVMIAGVGSSLESTFDEVENHL